MSNLSKETLINNLKKMGLKSSDTVMIHISMKKVGSIDANIVIDALMEYFKDGLLIIPTHTWANVNDANPIYNRKETPSCIGIVPNLFMKRANVYRSYHPTHSVAAYGADAIEFIKGEENNTTPCSPGGVYDRLRQRNAKILLIGVGLERNTYIHGVEELLVVPNRLSSMPMHLKIVMDDGSIKDAYVRKHYNQKQPHISDDFVKLHNILLDNKCMKMCQFGLADTLVCDANKCFNVIREILSKNPECIVESEVLEY